MISFSRHCGYVHCAFSVHPAQGASFTRQGNPPSVTANVRPGRQCPDSRCMRFIIPFKAGKRQALLSLGNGDWSLSEKCAPSAEADQRIELTDKFGIWTTEY